PHPTRRSSDITLPGIARSNTYECNDGKYIVIGGNGDGIFKRLMEAIGRPELGEDKRFQSNSGRASHADYLDEIIEDWTKTIDFQTALDLLDKAKVTAGPIYSITDIIKDTNYLSK